MTYVSPYSTFPTSPVVYGWSNIDLTGAITLAWPLPNVNSQYYLTQIMDVTSSDAANTINLPPANQIGKGIAFQFFNYGSENFLLQDDVGGSLATIEPGQLYEVYLTDNSSVAGSWRALLQGTGTSGADAAALAGYGLIALSNMKLNLNNPENIQSAGYTVLPSDRASIINYQGGSETITLPDPTGIANTGFVVGIINNSLTGGLATVVVDGGANINTAPSLVLSPGNGSIFYAGATSYNSIGIGQNVFNTSSILLKDVSGAIDVTLTALECANDIIIFIGTLTGSITVFFNPNQINKYDVTNNTTGAFTLSIQVTAGSLIYAVPQTNRWAFYTDGTELYLVNNAYISETDTGSNAGSVRIGKNAGNMNGFSTGIQNVMIGNLAASGMTSGNGNVIIGYNTQVNRTSITNSVFIGSGSGSTVDGLTNVMCFGHNNQANESNITTFTPYVMIGAYDGSEIGTQRYSFMLSSDSPGNGGFWIGRSASQTAPSLTGGVHSVSTTDLPMYTNHGDTYSGLEMVATSVTLGNLYYSDGTKIVPLPVGATGEVIVSNGTRPVYSASPSARNKNIIFGGNFDTNPFQRVGSGDTPPFSRAFTTNTAGYVADRFCWFNTDVSGGGASILIQKNNNSCPTNISGFTSFNSLFLTATVGAAVLGASDAFYYRYIVEGYDYTPYYEGTLTLSFNINATVTGTYCVTFLNGGADAGFTSEFTVVAGSTWQNVSISLPMPTVGATWNYTNGAGLQVLFVLAAGTGVATLSNRTWANPAGGICTAAQVNALAGNGNFVAIQGVQLEAGNVATAFELRPVAQELEYCQRYYQKTYNQGIRPGTAVSNGLFQSSIPPCTLIATAVPPIGFPKYNVVVRTGGASVSLWDFNAVADQWIIFDPIAGNIPLVVLSVSGVSQSDTGFRFTVTNMDAVSPGSYSLGHYAVDADF